MSESFQEDPGKTLEWAIAPAGLRQPLQEEASVIFIEKMAPGECLGHHVTVGPGNSIRTLLASAALFRSCRASVTPKDMTPTPRARLRG